MNNVITNVIPQPAVAVSGGPALLLRVVIVFLSCIQETMI